MKTTPTAAMIAALVSFGMCASDITHSEARASAWERIRQDKTLSLSAVKWGRVRPIVIDGQALTEVSLWHWPGGRVPPKRFLVWVDKNGRVVETKDTTPHEGQQVPPEWLVAPAGQEIVWAKTRFSGVLPVTIFEHPGKPYALDAPRGGTYEGGNDFPFPSETQPVTSSHNIFGDGSGYEDRKFQLFSDNAKTPAGEAQAGVELMNRFLQKFFYRFSYDNLGGKIDSVVHAGYEYNNAFYAGGPPDDPGWCQCLYYGDGGNGGFYSFGNFSDIEVIGHEFTHAMTAHTANLAYWGQSGGLNEATSDIFGKALEAWVAAGFPNTIPTPATLGEWTVGRRIFTFNNSPSPFRFMYKPSLDAALYGGSFWSPDHVTPDLGLLDVHLSSGPLNRWAYISSVGIKPQPNTLGSDFLREGLDYPAGFDAVVKIWYRALTLYLTENSYYTDAALAVDKAAVDLYGERSQQRAAVNAGMLAINAFPRWQAHIWPTVNRIDKQIVVAGDAVNLYGGGFTGSTITVGGVAVPSVVITDDNIQFHAPTNSGKVVVVGPTGNSLNQPYLEVAVAPKIESFSLSPGGFRLGDTVTLRWSSSSGTVTLNGEPVVPTGSQEVKPTATTSYVLIATTPAGVAAWTITAWYRPFDLTGDNKVDIFDVLEVRVKSGGTVPEPSDLNGDSKTDDKDLNLIWKELK